MGFKFAERMESLPPYLFAEINRMKKEMSSKGVDVIDLGIGDPDLPTPEIIVKSMQEEVGRAENHNYPPYDGIEDFKKQIAEFFKERFSVRLDHASEILPLIGSKEGIFHIPFVMLNEGDYVLIPDPGYPVYSIATRLIGGKVHFMPLLKENDFLPDLGEIPSEIAKRAKLLFINYPNNPTSAAASLDCFAELKKFAQRYDIVICHDMAYSEIYFGSKPPVSFLSVAGAKELCIEFHSLSKTFNMTGWRVGFAVGNQELVGALGRLKTNIDSGVFKAIQKASITGLKNWKKLTELNRKIISKRKDKFSKTLRELGYNFKEPQGTFYLWIEVPGGISSKEFVKRLLEKTGVVVTPGIGMGPSGDSYFRISLTNHDSKLDQALERLKRFKVENV